MFVAVRYTVDFADLPRRFACLGGVFAADFYGGYGFAEEAPLHNLRFGHRCMSFEQDFLRNLRSVGGAVQDSIEISGKVVFD